MTEAQRGSRECGEPSSASRDNWNFIWSARVPPKVRVFAWIVCRNGLPTVLNLERRGVYTQGVCAWCGSEQEDIMDCLLRCSFPRQVWALSHLRWSIISQEASSTEAWLRGLHRFVDMESFNRALLICWFLWGTRNRLLFDNIQCPAGEVMERVRCYEAAILFKG
ncbi:UNVERIFIED_CONTAM: hypothetical protein Slati_3138700 [Sesamum latifolium]|uniref:Reverse transcriptase zinc-binding domain-containing protein n=1 Tax=Sesamum latifolium TaxID=2727402 RepID=A0AAW2UWY1_9LAMI